jgi:hypothetical protein
MPDLPVEVWSFVVKHLGETDAKYKANLCAVARVNSVSTIIMNRGIS